MGKVVALCAVPKSELSVLTERFRLNRGTLLFSKRRTLAAALDCGDDLIAIKAQLPHGEWLPFLAREGVDQRAARNWMMLARNKSALSSDLDVSEALSLLRKAEAAEKELPESEPDEEKWSQVHFLRDVSLQVYRWGQEWMLNEHSADGLIRQLESEIKALNKESKKRKIGI